MKFNFLLFIGLLFSSTIYAQNQEVEYVDDTISIEYSPNAQQLKFDSLPYQSINGFHHYRPFQKLDLPIARMGNLGLGVHSYLLIKQSWSITSHLGAYQSYLFQKDSLEFYKMSRPFTHLSYANGSKEEQFFNVFHSQNLGEGLNISFEYQRMTSQGFYKDQLTNHTQFNTTFNLKNRSGKFRTRGYFLINDIEAQENGGILVIDADVEDDNPILLDVNLEIAQNQSRNQALGFKNELDLFRDSSGVILAIEHEIDWNKSYRNYSDDTTGSPNYYNNFFLNNGVTVDSSFTQIVSNVFKLKLFDNALGFGIKNNRLQFYQNSFINQRFSSNIAVAHFDKNFLNQQVSLYFEKGLSGYNKDEIEFKAAVKLEEWNNIKAKIEYVNSAKRVDYLIENNRSNHFFFRNNFKTSKFNGLKFNANLTSLNVKLETGFSNFKDFIYYDSTINPKQFGASISSFHIQFYKKFKFLTHINFTNLIRFQTFSESEVIPLPNLLSYHSLYYENIFFKNSLLFQIGADVFYIGENEGYEYSPALTQFHLNRNTSGLGNTFQVDLFINMRVNKSFRIFLKMENVTAKSFEEETYRVQDYAIPGKALKVGLSWRMVN